MIDVELILLFALTAFLLGLTPGPAVLLVVSQGTRSFRAAALSTLGILTAEAIYFALSACGLSAVLLASGSLFAIIKWLGVAYLIWLGVSMIRHSREAHTRESEPIGHTGGCRVWSRGLVTQLSNPKALTLFTALLPQFLTVDTSTTLHFIALGTTSLLVEGAILICYGALATRTSHLFALPRMRAVRERLGGACLICAAAGIAWSPRE